MSFPQWGPENSPDAILIPALIVVSAAILYYFPWVLIVGPVVVVCYALAQRYLDHQALYGPISNTNPQQKEEV